MPAVELRQVTKRFDGARAALDAVSLAAEPGEFLVLVGPSGCGKTTVLRCIAGLDHPTSGSIVINDRVVDDLPPGDRDVAMVFQNYALYPHLTVRENIAFPLRMRRRPRADIAAHVEATAATLGIDALLARRPAQLSGGERQRVALARAMVRRPAVFLYDEPLSNLDAALRAGMRAELSALHRRLGVTVVYVTHDQVEAMTLGHRVAVLQAGRIEQIGVPREVYARPATMFVAAFLGAPGMNVLPVATLARGSRVPAGFAGAEHAGFRPEAAKLGASDGADLVGRITLVEPLGPDTLVHVRLPSRETVIVRTRDERVPALETTVGVHVPAEHVHRFDAAGRRLP